MKFDFIPKQSLRVFRLTMLGYVLLGSGCSGFYQKAFWGDAVPYLFWIALGVAGGIVLAYKTCRQRREDRVSSFCFDLLFLVPMLLIPRLPMQPDVSMIFMLAYGVAFIIVYGCLYKKFHRG